MALALCLTLLPTALAEETDVSETPDAAVAAVQARIDALPDAETLPNMDGDAAMAAYDAVQAAYDAYEALSEEQQAQVTGADRFEALFGWFDDQVAPLADEVTGIWLDEVDLKTGEMTQGKQNWTATPLGDSDGNLTLTGGNMYVVGENQEVTIDGDLTVAGNSQNYLILFNGAKLIINGALILERNGLNICSHTESQRLDTIGQITINNSKEPSGAAIRSSTVDARTLNLCGGKLTANGGEYGAVSNVYLYRGTAPYPLKAALDGKLLPLEDWAFTAVDSPANKDLVIEWCGHEDNEKLSYVDNKDNATHHMKCDLCGFEWTEGEYSQLNHEYDKYEKINETYHKATCVCGYEASAQEHKFETGPDNKPVWTSDGKGHVSGVCACGYSSGTVEAHDYNESGTCKDCGFKPAFEDSKGNLYEYNGSDSIDALNEAIKKGETSFKLVNFAQGAGADAATVEAAFALETDANATLDMNGKTLKASGGTPVLAVSSGALTVTGNAAIIQSGASQETYKPAIEVTGGSLVFEGDLTAQGGKYGNYDRQPAVKATGGTVEFKGALNLDGGLFLDSCARLASKLTQGSFYSDKNDQGQVYRVQIENDFQHSYDLLADGYAFAEYDAATSKAKMDENGNPVLVKAEASGLMNKDLIIVEHTHSVAADQEACACGKQFEAGILAAEGGVSYYDTIDSAFAAAHEGDTVTLLADITNRGGRGIFVSGGPYTLDLNGHRIEAGIDLMVGDVDGSGVLLRGELTVKDSSTNNAGYVQSLKLWNGDLTVESGSFRWIVESGSGSVGTITITGGTADEVKHTSAGVTFRLSGGTFKYVENIVSGKPGDLLADNRAFFNRDNNFVNGYDDRYQAVSDVVVKEHTHSIVDGSCECGFTCAHDWSDKNGVCKKANCGYHCPHNAGATETDGVWACNTCGQTVTAKVVAPDSTTTYYADGYVNTNVKSGLYFAIKAAKTGSTVAALGGEYSGGYVTGGKTLTLDMSNGKTIDGILYVGEKEDSGNKLIVRGSAELTYVIVAPGNTLDLTGWTGRIGSLTVQSGGKATLNGGTFAMLNVNGATAGSLLAEGYAFQNAGTGAYVEYSSTDNMKNVKVVKCPHSGVTLKGDHTGAACKYCGASFAATLDDAPYGTIDAAITDWLANGGTLKLYTDYTATDGGTWSIGSGSQSHTINLNGHRMSVQNDGAFKPTNNMHLTVTDGTKLGQITNILLDGDQRGSFTLENGFVGNLKMTGGAVVALKGGSVDNLDVQNCSANTNLSIQGGSLGKLNIEDWADGMHVSATGGSLGGYTLPSGKILADVLDHQYYAEGTSLDKRVDAAAQKWEKFDIKQAPHDFGSTSKAANVPINGSIPFRVDSPSGDATGYYDVRWYRRTNSGAEHMTQNRVADVNVNDKLDVFCVITGADSPGGAMKWQVAVKGYTINVVPADLSQGAVVFKQVGESMTGLNLMGNIRDGKGTFVFTPWGGDVNNASTLTYCFEVSHDGQKLIEGKDYTIESGNTAQYAGDHTLTIQGKGSYTGTATHTWRIEPYKLTRENYNPPDITKVYDGTTGFDFSKAGNWGIFKENVDHRPNDEKTGKNPVLGSDTKPILIYLKPEDFKASAVTLDSPDAGDRTASFTIELKTRDGQREPNFVFEDGGSPTIQVTKAKASITKAAAPTGLANGALTVYNGTAKTYEIDIASLLPSPGAGCRYGKIYDSQTIGPYTYKTEITEIKLNSSYYDATANKAKIEKGKLILPIRNVNTTTTGKIGTIKLDVISQNYHQIKDWTIDVSAANQPVSTGGGSSSGGTVKTDTVTNPDGSVTKTETKKDGTVIETTTGKDGSTTKTETKKDGSSVTESKDAAGSTGTVKTDKNGNTEAETKVSAKAVEDAKKNGEAVKAPVEVKATRNSDTAPTVKIELPRNSGETKVEIPVSNVKPGTVAVLVHPDGTEEIVKNSLPTADGIQLTVNDGATVKIVDNSKDFADTRNHWAKDAIDFVSARELVNGISATRYAPDASATRAQLWTILARQNDADLNGGNTWYEKAQLWSKDKGISDGTQPDAAINRAQVVTMLWRAEGQPAAGGAASFTDVPADSYYAQAVAWAVEGGITTGVGGGRFAPNSTCTRAQIATFLYRYMK